MNKMKEVAELLGLKVGDSFTINKLGYGRSPFTFTDTGIVDSTGTYTNLLLIGLICGDININKLPFKPQKDDEYWTYSTDNWDVDSSYWFEDITDLTRYKAGAVFRTRQEAEENLNKIKKELEDYYKNN